ncbi:MAG: hypothetical protein ACO32I_01145 [Candidatus Limnocylindrus sp.]
MGYKQYWAEVALALAAKLPWALVPLVSVRVLSSSELATHTLTASLLGAVAALGGKWSEVAAASAGGAAGARLGSASFAATIPVALVAAAILAVTPSAAAAAACLVAVDNAAIAALVRFARKGWVPGGRRVVLANSVSAVGLQVTTTCALALAGVAGGRALLAGVAAGMVGGWWVMLRATHAHITRPRWAEVRALWHEGVRAGFGEVAGAAVAYAAISAGLGALPEAQRALWGSVRAAVASATRLLVVAGVAVDKVHSGTAPHGLMRMAVRVETCMGLVLAPVAAVLTASPAIAALAALVVAADCVCYAQAQRLMAQCAWDAAAACGNTGHAVAAAGFVGITLGLCPPTAVAVAWISVSSSVAELAVTVIAARRRN